MSAVEKMPQGGLRILSLRIRPTPNPTIAALASAWRWLTLQGLGSQSLDSVALPNETAAFNARGNSIRAKSLS